jgi:hypothetical protein
VFDFAVHGCPSIISAYHRIPGQKGAIKYGKNKKATSQIAHLTDEEWVLMKKHPAFAYEMLSPIHYLKAALEIPYCHHEK